MRDYEEKSKKMFWVIYSTLASIDCSAAKINGMKSPIRRLFDSHFDVEDLDYPVAKAALLSDLSDSLKHKYKLTIQDVDTVMDEFEYALDVEFEGE